MRAIHRHAPADATTHATVRNPTARPARSLVVTLALGVACAGVSACAGHGPRPPSAVHVSGPAPHLDRVVVNADAERPGHLYPTFYLTDPGGDADEVHRTVIAISGHLPDFNPTSHFYIPPEVQKRGAVRVGGWACDPGQITTTVRAYITDRRGACSNAMDYTVKCR